MNSVKRLCTWSNSVFDNLTLEENKFLSIPLRGLIHTPIVLSDIYFFKFENDWHLENKSIYDICNQSPHREWLMFPTHFHDNSQYKESWPLKKMFHHSVLRSIVIIIIIPCKIKHFFDTLSRFTYKLKMNYKIQMYWLTYWQAKIL